MSIEGAVWSVFFRTTIFSPFVSTDPARDIQMNVDVHWKSPANVRANCSAYVGRRGSLTWTLESAVNTMSWRIELDATVYLQEDRAANSTLLYRGQNVLRN
ncbi:hypothetical protein ElyMa_000603300 [Elysia marginata]|uniref:Uncharacterized protein n=1 Tax=Elysia marginata TaxID=1093978 RepID=A0AAV4G8R6_9GAST|nr:hypothetical protein ElyMa_000603300 [Elysia marginata]